MLRADMDALPIQEENEVDYNRKLPEDLRCGHMRIPPDCFGVTRC